MTTSILFTTAAAIFLYATVAWVISAWLRRADIIDPFWGPGFIVVTVVAAISGDRSDQIQWLIVALVSIWGLRLGGHLLIRWLHEPHEDRRYASMRAAGGDHWWLQSLATVFWLQAVILWFVASPLICCVTSKSEVYIPGMIAGILVFTVGLYFESVGDHQLATFKKQANNDSKVLKTGLWKYTRHPNYFGDFLVWWGLFITGISCGAPAWTVISPVIMSVLLMKVSGVGMLEKDISERRPDYVQYVQQTNTFFPWPPGDSSK